MPRVIVVGETADHRKLYYQDHSRRVSQNHNKLPSALASRS